MKTITFKFSHDGKEIPKTQAQNMFQNSNFTVKDDKVFLTTVSSPVSQFFPPNFQIQARKELLDFIDSNQSKELKKPIKKEIEELENRTFNSTRHKYNPVREALKQAEEHQVKNGRKEYPEAERFGNFLLDEDEDVQWHFTKLTPEEQEILNQWEGVSGQSYSKGDRGKKVDEKENNSVYDTKSKIEEKEKLTGVKETEGKLDYSEINFKLLDLMATRFSANKVKYGYGNTKKPLDLKQIEQATFRHLRKMIQPIEGDEETYLDHLSATATNLSIILDQLELQK